MIRPTGAVTTHLTANASIWIRSVYIPATIPNICTGVLAYIKITGVAVVTQKAMCKKNLSLELCS